MKEENKIILTTGVIALVAFVTVPWIVELACKYFEFVQEHFK